MGPEPRRGTCWPGPAGAGSGTARPPVPRVALLALLAVLAACAGPGQREAPSLKIEGLRFENRAQTAVQSIRLFVPASNNFVSCGRIDAGASCASAFPGVAWAGGPVQVTWVQNGQEWDTGALEPQPDEAVWSAGVAEVRVVVLAPGSAGVVFVPAGDP